MPIPLTKPTSMEARAVHTASQTLSIATYHSLKRTRVNPLCAAIAYLVIRRQMTDTGFEPWSCHCPNKYCSHSATMGNTVLYYWRLVFFPDSRHSFFFQCFDIADWVTGRASGLYEVSHQQSLEVLFQWGILCGLGASSIPFGPL